MASLEHANGRLRTVRGFTIVELLIVIVIIAILAVITIVAFNGIQQRAKASAASSALASAKKKLELYKVDNGSYPPTGSLALAGVTDSATTFQYTGSATTFCLTGTNSNVSYKVSEATSPNAGGCPGHGQAGAPAITNLSTNPRALASGTGWNSNNQAVYPATKGIAVTGNPDGITTATKGVLLSPNVNPCLMSLYNIDTLSNNLSPRNVGVWVMVDAAGYGAKVYKIGTTVSLIPLTANTWTWIQAATPITDYTILGICKLSGSASYSDTGYATGAMVLASDAPTAFRDGNSTDWVWTGATNVSTSTGPAL